MSLTEDRHVATDGRHASAVAGRLNRLAGAADRQQNGRPTTKGRLAMSSFEVLQGERYLNLESFRKSGQGVRTPVWFASEPGNTSLYVYSTADSGKAKRIRRSGVVRVAPCDARGKVTGPWIDAQASIVAGEAFRRGMQLINHKYRPWKQLLDLLSKLRPHERVVIAIRPQIEPPPA